MAETIRAFIAIELSDQIKETVRNFQEHLKPSGCDIAWVKPENIHLTLKFLGDVKTKMLPSVIETLRDVCKDLRPFDTTLTQSGVFPDLRHPRVVWVGLDDSDANLTRLAGLWKRPWATSASKGKRDFQAHITLGRIKSGKNIQRLSESLSVTSYRKASPKIYTAFVFTKASWPPAARFIQFYLISPSDELP